MPNLKSVGALAVIVGLMIAGIWWWRSTFPDEGPTPAQAARAVRSVRPAPARTYRILHVMSYHADWTAWTMAQFNGFKDELAELNVDYRIIELDANRATAEEIEQQVALVRQLIEQWKPELVYTTDDPVQEKLVRHYLGSELPFVFSGVNRDPSYYGFDKAPNVTGVLEREHIVQTVRLCAHLVPSAKRLAIITDGGVMWPAVIQRFYQVQNELPMQIVAADVVQSFQAYQQRMREYEQIADVVCTLGISVLTDESGQKVPMNQVGRWTFENIRLPNISFWDSRPPIGALCAVAVSGQAQGRAAGALAWSILVDRKIPRDLPILPTQVGRPILNLAVCRHLGIQPTAEILLSCEVIDKLEWQ